VTLSSGKEASPNIVIHSAKDGTQGDKKRRKQHPQGAMTTTTEAMGTQAALA
jgi:hypothetical protein